MTEHPIPPITNPLGRHWNQPARDQILIDETYALMERTTFEALADYSATVPTGVYEGKMWRRHDGVFMRQRGEAAPAWLLCWYGPSPNPDHCLIEFRKILLVDGTL